MNKRVATVAVVFATVAMIGAAPSRRVERFLGGRAVATLQAATRVEVLRLSTKRAKEGEPALGGYLVTGQGAEQGEAFARRLAGVMLEESSYDFLSSKRGGFEPLVGLRSRSGAEWTEIVLSFASSELVVLSPVEGGGVRSAQEDFDGARAALIGLVKEALPEDPAVRALGE